MASSSSLISLDTPILRRADAATAEVDGQLVALDVTQGVCYGLNHVATAIWRKLDGETTAAAIIDALLEEYDVDRESCTEQTLELVRDLVQAGLARVAPAR